MAAAVQSLSSSSLRSPGIGECLYGIAANSGAFMHCMDYLTTEDLFNSCEVSKIWKAFIDGPNGQLLWKNLSIREGVPVVEGNDRNYKDEFRFLRHITIGGKTIARYLGEIVGEVPRMRQDYFFELRDSQDFFEPARLKRETHVVLVDPAALKITVSPDRPLTLGKSGTLVEVPEAERARIEPRELIVPLSFKNLRALAAHPLEGKENGPVFNLTFSVAEVFNKCNAPSDQNRILIMRREVVARDTLFNGDQGQEAQVTNRRWEVMTVRPRSLYDAIEILETGTCPDRVSLSSVWTYVRSAERIRFDGFFFNARIGAFVPGAGLQVFHNSDSVAPDVGVVPVVSAEVLRPEELG